MNATIDAVMQFAWLGRVACTDPDDVQLAWQRQHHDAAALLTGHGRIVASYFDTATSRATGWSRRPRASALLAALDNPGHGFDAVVVADLAHLANRAGLAELLSTLSRHRMPLWSPQTNGPADPDHPLHRHLASILTTDPGEQAAITARIRAASAGAARTTNHGGPS